MERPSIKQVWEAAKPGLLPSSHLSIGQFWETAHKTKELLYLSGYPGAEIWERLRVVDRIVPRAVVLNIGVGMGHCTRALAERGCIVHALDISREGLASISDIATTWHVDELDRIPSKVFDLVLSHLVWQHMRDDALDAQMGAVFRSLKTDGLWASQFSVPCPNGPPLHEYTELDAMGGRVLRTNEIVARLVYAAGGKTIRFFADQAGPDWAWHVVHLTRADGPWWRRWYDRVRPYGWKT